MSGAGGRDQISDLPQDILGLILLKIRLVNDIKRFGAVCRQWRIAAVDYTKNRVCFGTQWLIKKKLMESSITLYYPMAENTRRISIDIPQICGASILCSKEGWLLMNKGCEVFLLSPFSKFIIKLPNLPCCGVTFTGFAITCTPTSKDWHICGLRPYQKPNDQYKRKFGIFTIGYRDKKWTRTLGTVPYGCFVAHETNPVYHKGRFYFLCTNGALGVLDATTRSWKILAFKKSEDDVKPYLLECDGELVAVFNWSEKNVKIRKFDESRMIWNEVKDIGEYTFFLSEKTSYAKKSIGDYMKNKLFSTNLYENYGIFYCLKNHSYQTFGNDLSCEKIANTTIVFECCWMEPTRHDLSSSTKWLETLSFDQCTSHVILDEDEDDDDDDEVEADGDINYSTEEEDLECLYAFERAWYGAGWVL